MTCLICKAMLGDTIVYQEQYQGNCKHENTDIGYGFRASWGCKGIGVYTECYDCEAVNYSPDSECTTKEEKEWFDHSPFSKGWVLIKYEDPNPEMKVIDYWEKEKVDYKHISSLIDRFPEGSDISEAAKDLISALDNGSFGDWWKK